MNLTRLNERVICLIDMDCFYVQVEEIEQPEFRGKPCGVSQYNPYKGGGLIAVNYEARSFGVKRGMRGEEAKKLCPDFNIFYVREKRGKADLSKYREASLKIFEIILKHCDKVEKASIDEAYLDLTDLVMERFQNKSLTNVNFVDSFVYGSFSIDDSNNAEKNLKAWLDINQDLTHECSDVFLIIGACIVQEIRQDIKNTLGYHCSAGIAQNKTLAKLCAGLNKPNKQTILPANSVEELLQKIPINKIKNLGGKLGSILHEQLGLNTVGDLARQNLNDLVKYFGEKTGNWLNQISHGIDQEPVSSRSTAKSIGCSKNFRGKLVLNNRVKVEHWVRQLCEELEERLESDRKNNNRDPTLLVLHITNEAGTFSKSTSISPGKYTAHHFVTQVLDALNGYNKSKTKDDWYPAIYTLGISAAKFVEKGKNMPANSIEKFFNSKPIDKSSEIQPCTSNNIDADIEIVTEENSNDNSFSNENNLEIESKEVSSENSIKNSSNKMDIRCLLLKQKEKATKEDESDMDADNFEEEPIILIEEKNDKKEKKSSEKINSYFMKNSKEEPITDSYDDIDYVLCDKCNKKILSWEMPEHEDFHFAQMISREQSRENINSNNNVQNNAKKRIAENTPTKEDKSSKKTQSKNSKKLKTELSETLKSGTNSINNYFKKN
ncbi:unnamed protein product [Brachionus calyciflorus]|uniref:DNA polymerase eta n=1 Tax=Brachionus calyciflorus TaxID=104777 RepID=A0A813WA97_9BILA|nr:unnamed protein product [Brachionus calyciflorus]